jgi:signal transduction histidine kinase
MGSRGRSIRLRIYFLVAIPLITMLGLFGYVAYTSVTNWLNLDRAPSLIESTSEPLTNFVNVLQNERRAAMVYLAKPGSGSLATFQAAADTTKKDAAQLSVTLRSPATTDSASPAETAAIDKMLAQLNGMTPLRSEVLAKKLAPIDALSAYTNIIAGQGAVLEAEADSITSAAPVLQGLGLISAVNTQEDMSEQDAVLASALVSGSLTGTDRVAFSQAVGRQQDDTMTYQELLTPAELATYTATVNKLAPKAVQDNLTTIQDAVPAGISLTDMEAQGLSPATWQQLTGTWLKASSAAGTTAATTVLEANAQPAVDAKRRVWITAAVGVAGLILTLIVTILLAQSINRRLARLRTSALALAQEQLPAVVARLRRGESVDVTAEAPPLRAGNDEIGQVGEAIDTVRQVAIRSAVEEARVRQGVNDMFRNLARRNQSLLQRQLTVLDGMERRATDPDVLEDLFKMDHLTTRMRRHAEGLIILSGAAPGRSWSAPVKLVDVMRGAVAEVEDYARVTVSTQSKAALSGSAVTDVIHLLAELIENATTLSPPFTQVRVSGETVANGFAIEIEDRGLGMVPQRMYELNERLSNPPDLNPANTEQLGLFVVGQLARRHGIRVMLRPSPYGGVTAVALIPLTLVVEEGPAAITAGGRAPAAAGAAAAGLNGANGNRANGANGNGASGGAFGTGAYPNGNGYPATAPSVSPAGAGMPWAGTPDWPAGTGRGDVAEPAGGAYATPAAYGNGGAPQGGTGYPTPAATDPRGLAAESGGYGPQDAGGPPIRTTGALRHPSAIPSYGSAGGASPAEAGPRRGRHGSDDDDVHVVTSVPFGRSGQPPHPPFDVFTPLDRPDADNPYQGGNPYQGDSGYQGDVAAYQGDGPYQGSSPYGEGPQLGGAPYAHTGNAMGNTTANAGGGATGPGAAGPGSADLSAQNLGGRNLGARDPGTQAAGSGEASSGDADDFKGLPRRVRQASLAPQLRASGSSSGPQESPGVPPATAASLTDMRNTLSAMQRGWQQARSQTPRDTESGADGD